MASSFTLEVKRCSHRHRLHCTFTHVGYTHVCHLELRRVTEAHRSHAGIFPTQKRRYPKHRGWYPRQFSASSVLAEFAAAATSVSCRWSCSERVLSWRENGCCVFICTVSAVALIDWHPIFTLHNLGPCQQVCCLQGRREKELMAESVSKCRIVELKKPSPEAAALPVGNTESAGRGAFGSV